MNFFLYQHAQTFSKNKVELFSERQILKTMSKKVKRTCSFLEPFFKAIIHNFQKQKSIYNLKQKNDLLYMISIVSWNSKKYEIKIFQKKKKTALNSKTLKSVVKVRKPFSVMEFLEIVGL